MTAALLEKIRDALAADTELIAWCSANLASTPTIQLDFDEEQELEADCYPFVGVLTVQHDSDIHQRRATFTMRMLVAVRNSALNSEIASVDIAGAPTSVKVRTYPGRLQAESLREQVINALYRGQLGKVSIVSDDMSHTYIPKFYSPLTVTIETIL